MSITLNLAQATHLLNLFGGEPGQMTVSAAAKGHSGPGLYAHCTEYPEEGATYLGSADADPDERPDNDGPEKAVITLTQLPDDSVSVAFDFLPPLDRAEPERAVHFVAGCAMEALGAPPGIPRPCATWRPSAGARCRSTTPSAAAPPA